MVYRRQDLRVLLAAGVLLFPGPLSEELGNTCTLSVTYIYTTYIHPHWYLFLHLHIENHEFILTHLILVQYQSSLYLRFSHTCIASL